MILLKEIIDQIRSVVGFSGFNVETISAKKLYVTMELRSRSRFRKKTYQMAISRSINGLLAAERELKRITKQTIIIFDPVNNLLKPTFDNVELFHDLDALQDFLNK